jgi:peroxiredoxin
VDSVVAQRPLGPGDRAPEFDLPAADGPGRVSLAEHLDRGPVLLVMLRGLYCPFCRRQISQLRPACETLRTAGLPLVGLVIASPERARQYFRRFPPCFPVAAAPDRAIHRAYGLSEVTRTPDFSAETQRRAAQYLRELGLQAPPGQATAVFMTAEGFQLTAEDEAEKERPLQSIAFFLVGRDRLIRWTLADARIVPLPPLEELLALV